MEAIRIQKYLSDCGAASRRAAEKLILDGKITVNGQKAEIGCKVIPMKDKVVCDGVPVVYHGGGNKVYIMMYKPRGYVTTLSDEKGRRCVTDLLSALDTRVYPVGRLDMDSEGLLLLTNDGELTNKLTHPSGHVSKVYHVTVAGHVTSDKLGFLRSQMVIDGYTIAPVKTDIIEERETYTILRMTLNEGRNRQIRKMCEKADLKVTMLKRVAIGEINVGTLQTGKWRELSDSQIAYLKSI